MPIGSSGAWFLRSVTGLLVTRGLVACGISKTVATPRALNYEEALPIEGSTIACPASTPISTAGRVSVTEAAKGVGIKEVHDDIWLVSFMDYDLGYFDLETRVLEPLKKSVWPKSVTYV